MASLGVMEAFDRACPRTPETTHVRQLLGAKAFGSWRRLPYDFLPEFDRRLLALWRRNPDAALADLGGNSFQRLARLLGPVRAGRLLRRFQRPAYATCRTTESAELNRWLAQLPA